MNPEMFTERARMVLQLALQEAQRLGHKFVGTEHILLAIAKEGTGVAANVLKNLDVDVGKIRAMTEQLLGKQESTHSAGLVDEFLPADAEASDMLTPHPEE